MLSVVIGRVIWFLVFTELFEDWIFFFFLFVLGWYWVIAVSGRGLFNCNICYWNIFIG